MARGLAPVVRGRCALAGSAPAGWAARGGARIARPADAWRSCPRGIVGPGVEPGVPLADPALRRGARQVIRPPPGAMVQVTPAPATAGGATSLPFCGETRAWTLDSGERGAERGAAQ